MNIAATSSDRTAARIERTYHRQSGHKVIGHGTRDSRWTGVQNDIGIDHGSVERNHSAVIGSQDRRTARRNVFCSMSGHPEPVFVERLQRRHHSLYPVGMQSKDVVAVTFIKKADSGQLLLFLLTEQSLR
jgi:hypothetical protein